MIDIDDLIYAIFRKADLTDYETIELYRIVDKMYDSVISLGVCKANIPYPDCEKCGVGNLCDLAYRIHTAAHMLALTNSKG